jgi:hypothetical protein
MKSKLCPNCDELKRVDAFSRCKRNASGLQSWCKACLSIYAKEHPHQATVPEKMCKACGYPKPASDFSRDTAKKDGLRNVCKAHDSKLRRDRWNQPVESEKARNHREGNRPKAILKSLRQQAKKRGIQCILIESDLAAVPIPTICPVLGIEMFWTQGKRTINTPSIDRPNPGGNYERGNFRYISWMANRLKSDCSDPEVFEAIAADLRRLGFGTGRPAE